MKAGTEERAWKCMLFFAIVISSFLFCFARGIATLFEVWRNSYIYSYGFLVPFVSSYIVWTYRDRLKSLRASPNYSAAFPLLFAGLAVYIFGISSGVVSLQGISLVMTIASIVLVFFGGHFLMSLWFPIAYLLFMVPFWDNLTEILHPVFQGLSTAVAAGMLQMTGIPFLRESVYIQLPNITLEVSEVCSGVNNLIAVLAFAVPLAYVSLKSWPRRIVLVASGIVIAGLFNGLRIALIGVLAYYGIGKVLHGPNHVLQAMSVSIIGFIVLIVMARILSGSAATHRLERRSVKRNSSGLSLKSDFYLRSIRYALVMTSFVMIFVGIYINFIAGLQ
jgi:exosortase